MKQIIQWNVNVYYTHYEQLQILLKQQNPTVLCLQETNFKKHQHSVLKGFSTFIKNRNCESYSNGRVFISVSEKYNATEIPLNTNVEAIAVTASISNKIHICNMYIPNSQTLHLTSLEQLVKQL